MKMNKSQRQALILLKIQESQITTQEELVSKLQEAGADVTQATISRDIRELNIVKASDADGVSRYCTMQRAQEMPDRSLLTVFLESTIRIDLAQNLVVVHTLPGLASGNATLIDSLNSPEIVGCIAGDDTIFIACRNEREAEQLLEHLRRLKESRSFL